MNMNSIFSLFTLICGFYCLYAYYQLMFKSEINNNMMLPRNKDPKKCKNFKEYRKAIQLPLLVTGITVTVNGIIDYYNTKHDGAYNTLFLVSMLIAVIAIVWYAAILTKSNKKYFPN